MCCAAAHQRHHTTMQQTAGQLLSEVVSKAKKAMQLVQTPMLRTGTHNGPMMASGAGGVASQGVTMGAASGLGNGIDGMKQPAVWRREQASEQVQAMQRNGVETYDIPAFLRKQAD